VRAFTCRDVVPGCTARFTGPDDESVLGQVAVHAVADHGLAQVPAVLVAQVRAAILTA